MLLIRFFQLHSIGRLDPVSNAEIRKDILRTAIDQLKQVDFSAQDAEFLLVDVASQRLLVCQGNTVLADYRVSTAAKGRGCQTGSFQTPVGVHRIAEKIGAGQPAGMIFEGRIATGRIAEIQPDNIDTGQDLITSRILWLQGMQPGVNRGAGVDTHERYIYIHGTHEEGRLGQPVSHGCIRLANQNIIDLYDRVEQSTPVVIM